MEPEILNYFDSKIWFAYERCLDDARAKLRLNLPIIQNSLKNLAAGGELPTPESKPLTSISDARRLDGFEYTQSLGSLAIVDIKGTLYFSESRIDDFIAYYFGGTSTSKLMKDVQKLHERRDITDVILNVNSGGGEAFGINELSDAIKKLCKSKNVVAYISGYGASAAYFIPANASQIVTDKMALLGSIGVVSQWIDYTDYFAQMGIFYEAVTSDNAPYKRLSPKVEGHREIFKQPLNQMESVFISSIAKGRNVTTAFVKENFGKGSVMSGEEAIKVKMADRIGSLEGLIAEMSGKSQQSKTAFSAETQTGVTKMSVKDKFFAWLDSADSDDSGELSITSNQKVSAEVEQALKAKAEAETQAKTTAAELAKVKVESAKCGG